MKLLFCSSLSGRSGTTTNLAAIAAAFALFQNRRVVMMQTQNIDQSLNHILCNDDVPLDSGIDTMIRMIKSELVTRDMIDSCCVDLYQGKLNLLPATNQNNESMYEAVISPMLIYCMNAVNLYYDISLFDFGEIQDNDIRLQQADVIVYNISQSHEAWQQSLRMEENISKKIFYLIGNYDPISKYNQIYFSKKFKIPSKRIGVIPYNTMLKDACFDGNLLKYLLQISFSTKDEMNYYLRMELGHTIDKLLHFYSEVVKKQ